MFHLIRARSIGPKILAVLASASVEFSALHAQRLLVASSANNSVLAYDAGSGAFLGALVPSGSGGLSGPRELHLGPDGKLYVASLSNDSVLRYQATSGTFVDAFVPGGSGGLHLPWALAWGIDGELLATSATGPCVLRYHLATGAPLGSIVCDGAPSVFQGLIVGPSRHLFVSDFGLQRVQEYDSAGIFLRTYLAPGNFSPRGLTIGPNGHLFATSLFDNRVAEFDTANGAYLGNFVASGSGGLSNPQDLAFRPNGNLLVASSLSNSVLEYGPTGAFVRVLVSAGSGGLSGPVGLLLEGGPPKGGRPALAEYGDAPDAILGCEAGPACTVLGRYPSVYGTTSAAAGRQSPLHLLTAADKDCWFGNLCTDEAAAFQPCCDWLNAINQPNAADRDDGPILLCLDPLCMSGVFVATARNGVRAAIAAYGPPPPQPVFGFWIYKVGMGANADPNVDRYINIAVDSNLNGKYGEMGEWTDRDQPFPFVPGNVAFRASGMFPVITAQPCGGALGWCITPFWTRFHVSPEPMLPSFPNGDWDGSSGSPDGYPWGETEDWVVYGDPGGSNAIFPDCNMNGRPDFADVYFGTSPDANGNEIPDECEINDTCSTPLPLQGYGPFPFDTAIATTGSEGQGYSLCNHTGTTAIANDLWYLWNAPASGIATVTTCGQTGVDTKVAVHGGFDCPTGPPLACVNDSCGLQTQASWSATAGDWYTIQLGNHPGTYPGQGTFEITIDGGSYANICNPGVDGVRVCPCSNPPTGLNRGCNNTAHTGGAVVSSTGFASLSSDSLVFTTNGERPTAFSVVLQGNAVNLAGFIFGQGVRCVHGTMKRLYKGASSYGSFTAPQPGNPSVSSRSASMGDPIQTGQHRYYSVYYRDSTIQGGCPATSTFNTTQSLDVTWSP